MSNIASKSPVPEGHTTCIVSRKGDGKISTGKRGEPGSGDIMHKVGAEIVLPDEVVIALEERAFVAVVSAKVS